MDGKAVGDGACREGIWVLAIAAEAGAAVGAVAVAGAAAAGRSDACPRGIHLPSTASGDEAVAVGVGVGVDVAVADLPVAVRLRDCNSWASSEH